MGRSGIKTSRPSSSMSRSKQRRQTISGKSRSSQLKLRLKKNNKRRAPPSISSDDSSSEDMNSGNEEDDDEDGGDSSEDDDEDSTPAAFAPSYGGKKRLGHKTGRTGGISLLQDRKLKGEQDAAAAADDDVNEDVISVSSVSSVSPGDIDDSDDSDDYQGVDEVSDGEDEELMLEKIEEEIILESENERSTLSRLAGSVSGGDEWTGLDDLEHRPFYSAGSFFDDEHLLLQSGGHSDAVDAGMTSEAAETPIQRRVHFETDDSSDSGKSSDEDELFPDFLHQDQLDPDLRRMIETDSTPGRSQSSFDLFVNSDFCDLPDNIYHVEESDNSMGSSSGYESDDGETTDEEDYLPLATITHPRSLLRRESSASLSGDEENKADSCAPQRGPLRGTFIADPHKPVAVVAPNGRQLILIPPYASSRHEWLESAAGSLVNTANNSPRTTTMHNVDDSDTDALVSPRHTDMSPMLSSNANLMMSALGNDSVGQVTGPPEAFYPTNGYLMDASFDEDEDDSEAMLNVDDFINFSENSSDDERDDSDEPTSPAATSTIGCQTPTPRRPSGTATDNDETPTQASSAERLLNHLDRGIVTAFRRNHNRYQALIRLPHHREFLPANSPSQPASAFKRSNPRTPTRKRQASTYLGSEAVRRKLVDSHRSRRNTVAY
ncbi:hypothetical protein GTR04_4839 [Trichophyton interdigitale]|uniref:Uncharacterized protein n=1 Tax=Trichophyton interdigitale TaxID=101480 RepID=A0A9P5CYC5_9EURO|nr:hypothetical protein GY631_4676 [Trichophyton interdigitale]KAF3897201.1 hypothetical protein GY632_2390 [Trichophyton interdigitale]KAG8207766.1 hypothetical protein GTR04_4839 [Trichophyton interdigitale]